MISREPVNMIYAKTNSTVKNREYAFTKTFESDFYEDTFFNSCLLYADQRYPVHVPNQTKSNRLQDQQ